MSKPIEPIMPLLSVIIPTSNEINNQLLQNSLKSLQRDESVEIIIVDKNSTDGSQELFRSLNLKLHSTSENSRAERLNIGIRQAKAPFVLLHHPRNQITPSGLLELKSQLKSLSWGGFTHTFFEENHFLLNFTSWYSNNIRFDWRGILYLDHCIFFDKKLLTSDSLIPKVDIFEDSLLSYKLRKQSKPIRLKSKTYTSSIRFRKNGFIKQSLINQLLKLSFLIGLPKTKMNKFYEKNLHLNSDYPSSDT